MLPTATPDGKTGYGPGPGGHTLTHTTHHTHSQTRAQCKHADARTRIFSPLTTHATYVVGGGAAK